ncbi:MAG: tetratricopeptide repeat protein, partial [Bacteroidota bacterium]|nr:tetratricopeptide repeat protein [Bacteroidota bacterium]
YNADGEKLIEKFIYDHEGHPKSLNAYNELGNFYYKDKNYAKAVQYFEKVDVSKLSQDKKAEVQFKTRYSYFSRKDFDKALQRFNTVKRYENPYTPASNYYAGYIGFRNEDYDNALMDLKRAAQSETYASIVPSMIANIYYKQKRYDELLAYADGILKDSRNIKNSEEIFLLAAEAHYKNQNYAKAAEYLDAFIKGNPTKADPQVVYRLAYSQYATGQNEKAIDNFKAVALQEDTVGQFASYYLGALYLKENNKVFAVSAFDKARKIEHNKNLQEQAAFNFAKVQYDLGNHKEAIEAFIDFNKMFPKSTYSNEANDLLSDSYLNSSDYDLAIKHIESLNSKSENVKKIYQKVTLLKGTENFNNARYFNAVQMFQKSLEYPYDPEFVVMAHYWSGEAYSIGRKYEEAINSYASVLRTPVTSQTPHHLKARYGIGYAYYNTGQFDKALVHFKEYVDKVEKSNNKLFYNDALIRLADSYYANKSYNNALNTFEKAIKLDNPDKDYAYYQMGVIQSIQGNPTMAHNNFDIVINQFPNSRYIDNTIFEKAQLDFEQGKYESAVAYFSRLIQTRPQSTYIPYALQRRALANANLNNYEKSITDYKRILDEYASHTVANGALLGLQQALTNVGKSDQFAPYMATYKKANPDNKALETIEFESAKNLYFSEKYENAIKGFNEFSRNYQGSSFKNEAHFYTAESYYRLDDSNKALENYYDVIKQSSSPLATRAISRIAELESRNKRYPEAIKFYHQLANRAQSKKEQYNAWAGLMESHYLMGKYDSSAFYANTILERGNVNANASNTALLYLGKSAYAKGDLDEAVDHFLNALNTPKDANGAEAQYLVAEIMHKRQQYKQSIETLYNLNTSFSAYENWLGRSFLLIADNYIAMDEFFQAKATLNSVIEKSPDPKIVEKARNKLLLISDKETKKKEAEKIDTSGF